MFESSCASFINMLVPFQLFPHSKILSKSIIEPNEIMRFNKIFCESNHPLQEGAIWGNYFACKVESIHG